MGPKESTTSGSHPSPNGGARVFIGVLRWIWAHPSNEGRRLRQVLHAVRFQVQGRLLHRPMVTPLGQRSVLLATRGDTAAGAVVYANPPNHAEMCFWSAFLSPGDLFVDVGANIGSYSVWACEQGAEVIAAEPHPGVRAKLQANLDRNGYQAEVTAKAMGAAPGTACFTAGRGTTNRMIDANEAQGENEETFDVEVSTLDVLVGSRSVQGVKIDVEGFERVVVEGAVGALAAQRIDVLQLEWNDMSLQALGEDRAPVADLLRSFGYELMRPDGSEVDATFGADAFAVSPRVLDRVRAILGGSEVTRRHR